MKKISFLLLLLLVYQAAICQQTDSLPKSAFQKEQLLSKAKSQKTVGWIMFGTGAPVVLGSLYSIIAFSSRDFEQDKALVVLTGSTVYTLIGYSLIKSGNKAKREALSLHLINNRIDQPFLVKSNLSFQPAFSLQLKF